MTVFVHPNGYYGYAFMFERKRYSHTFKGLSKDDVATKEMEHKLALKKKLSYIANLTVHTWEDAVYDFKIYANGHYTRPTECMYIIDAFIIIKWDVAYFIHSSTLFSAICIKYFSSIKLPFEAGLLLNVTNYYR